jgi:hypothetical protein
MATHRTVRTRKKSMWLHVFRSLFSVAHQCARTTHKHTHKNKLRGLSLRANYTERATAVCRLSKYQLLRLEQSARWIPYGRNLDFLLLISSSFTLVLTSLQLYNTPPPPPMPCSSPVVIRSGLASRSNSMILHRRTSSHTRLTCKHFCNKFFSL